MPTSVISSKPPANSSLAGPWVTVVLPDVKLSLILMAVMESTVAGAFPEKIRPRLTAAAHTLPGTVQQGRQSH